ncbi:MAG: hypothetical protein U0990_06370 [Candidatus Nanopelagicales bacterium]|nr:hypothetical protein [Candidatus Nanopelagicales bacterium]
MVQGIDSIRAVEDLLRGKGVRLTPVEPHQEAMEDLQTADGRFTISPARVVGREENLVTLYRTDTAESVPTNVNESVKRLSKRYPSTGDFAAMYPQLAGRYAFTLGVQDPVTRGYGPPVPLVPHSDIGELCWLNPKSERFEWTRGLGVRSLCRYAGQWLPLRLREHIERKHHGVWPLIEEDRRLREKEQEREDRRSSEERIQKLFEVVLQQSQAAQSPTPARGPKRKGK